jgi:carbon monoxide dehydrogenase subunit G
VVHLDETRTINRPLEEVFDYVADFSNTAEWDPGVKTSERMDEGPVGVGSQFDLVTTFAGSEVPLVYEMTEHESPTRIVLIASSKRLSAVDTIEFSPVGNDQTRVHYRADFELNPPLKYFELFMRPIFNRLGKKALDGLKSTLG